jgi:single-strand DNA-binding protein
MQITGRITKDASIHELKDGRKVVNFSIAVNDYYKSKNKGEGVKTTTYYNCAYWMSTNIAPYLTKGALVEVFGRIYVDSYIGANGQAKATINCHVNLIKIHSSVRNDESKTVSQTALSRDEVRDDLPF